MPGIRCSCCCHDSVYRICSNVVSDDSTTREEVIQPELCQSISIGPEIRAQCPASVCRLISIVDTSSFTHQPQLIQMLLSLSLILSLSQHVDISRSS